MLFSSVIDSHRSYRYVYFSEAYALGQNTPNMEQARIEPPRPLPSISLSNLGVRKRFELHFRFSIDLYGRYRTQHRMASEIRRVTDAWNTPARLVSFPTVRYVYKTSAYSKRFETNSRYTDHESPATSGFRFNTDLYVDLDQGCDRRVESDFNTDSY